MSDSRPTAVNRTDDMDGALMLRTMAPSYSESQHGIYARTLFHVCNPPTGRRPRNVALMGAYGTGKSSIIQGFENIVRADYQRRSWWYRLWHRCGTGVPECIKVTSLLLCPEGERQADNYPISEIRETKELYEDEDSGFAHSGHAAQGRSDVGCADAHAGCTRTTIRRPAENFQTEEIQKEIIKQLIYSIRPDEVNQSHFRRLRSNHTPREYVKPIVLMTLLSVLIATVGNIWTNQLTLDAFLREVSTPSQWASNMWFLLGLVLIAVGLLLVVLFIDELQTFSIQATVADSVSLSYDERKTIDIFDKYVDEIVYLLEKERIRYVVFEDLDRAADWSIYYELRELNTLINASTQTRGQTVTFIYVMGDAVMDTNEYDADDRVWTQRDDARSPFSVAERKAKFFDVSVYVRPFITVGNANAVFRGMLGNGMADVSKLLVPVDKENDYAKQ